MNFKGKLKDVVSFDINAEIILAIAFPAAITSISRASMYIYGIL